MALLKDYSTLETIVKGISYLTENETDDFIDSIYNYILYGYGNRTQAPILTSGLSDETISNIINNKYTDLWEIVKQTTTDNSLTSYITTETTHNSIYGYNSGTGVDDYERTRTIVNGYDNVYENYTHALDFFRNNCYYAIVACSLVDTLTLSIYESED